MPPVLRCTASLPSASCAKQLCRAAPSSRSFSTSLRHEQRITRARRGLFRWLATHGANFVSPLENSTNYLGAYNAMGQLKRVADATREKEEEKKNEAQGAVKGSERSGKSKDPEEKKLPPETNRDLVPFPLNRNFLSQPVLGGMVKEEVWFRIMVEGKSVREVSAELGIEMSRVGAVVRLKEIEKEWERIVSSTVLNNPFPPNTSMMIYKNSISLQDNYMVTKFTHASLSDNSVIIPSKNLTILETFR